MASTNQIIFSGNKFSFRTAILVTICLQNAGYTLLRKYSTQTENVSSKEILLVSEVLKVLFASYFILKGDEKSDAQGEGLSKLLWLIKHSGKMFILAVIYGAMNILSFVALQYIGAGEFTICAQVGNVFVECLSFVLLLLLLLTYSTAQNSYNCCLFRYDSSNFFELGQVACIVAFDDWMCPCRFSQLLIHFWYLYFVLFLQYNAIFTAIWIWSRADRGYIEWICIYLL